MSAKRQTKKDSQDHCWKTLLLQKGGFFKLTHENEHEFCIKRLAAYCTNSEALFGKSKTLQKIFQTEHQEPNIHQEPKKEHKTYYV